MLNSTFYNEMLFTKLARPSLDTAGGPTPPKGVAPKKPAPKKPAAPKKPDSNLFSFLPAKARAFASQGQQAMQQAAANPEETKKNITKAIVGGISKGRARESVPSRIGLTSKRFTMPQFLSSYSATIPRLADITDEKGANTALANASMKYFGTDPKDGSALTYFTPQNVNRAAMLGGTVMGGVGGGNTLKSWGAGLGGSVGGSLLGGYASEGLNRAIDAYYDIPQGSDRGYVRRAISDVLLPSAAAMAGGYYAGRATR